ncbi:MAG: isoprenylcysteine carboxylmethyltransferase family protein [Candidatus Heimdallarchaeota archaeon]|nr:isoprenylcysteine carboxylmethyltransferase family protein [Candidatus Heimdallarchaeota archaeon]MCK4876459.1 isoprenylcysteine carboxylmethyltransferase family protein [Candidatus Heimdallarchaeota archaeon]
MKLLEFFPVTITWISILSQIILTFVLWSNYYDVYGLVIVGYIFWGFSVIFGLLPIFTFRKKGDLPEKSSYIHTTKLVDTGIYAIVRHPQFLAGILWSVALVFLSQHWVVDILFIPVIITTYVDSQRANKDLLEKFGEDYRDYMKRVPNLNVIWGIILLVIHNIKKEKNN